LGATLYELLTLETAFGEAHRSELLKQIAFEEPRPLRKIDRHTPAELETIVLKAMAKSPNERYQAAQLLADDLWAYLENRPIKAKPPTLLNRANKWSQRHIGVVRAAIASLLIIGVLSTVCAAVVTRFYYQADAQRVAAEDKTNLAERERRHAEVLLARLQLQNGAC
jgi:serine/threonine protein kinase